MPPHSSHLLEPLVFGCFDPLKQAYGRQIERKMRAGTTHITKEDFFPACMTAFQESITEKNIRGGFRGADLVPLNLDSVISRLDVKLRTPTPFEDVDELPAPWVSKTPNNPIEASSQSEFSKNRISRHQGSSPTSILHAVDQFAKGGQGIMHQIALLRSENHILRQENETLSRRRRAKKKRLREGRSLTLGQGHDSQGQNEVDMQLEEESRRNGRRKRRPETKERRCGVCGKAGHNARRCQIEVAVSQEQSSN
jgi:hypothetical protein